VLLISKVHEPVCPFLYEVPVLVSLSEIQAYLLQHLIFLDQMHAVFLVLLLQA